MHDIADLLEGDTWVIPVHIGKACKGDMNMAFVMSQILWYQSLNIKRGKPAWVVRQAKEWHALIKGGRSAFDSIIKRLQTDFGLEKITAKSQYYGGQTALHLQFDEAVISSALAPFMPAPTVGNVENQHSRMYKNDIPNTVSLSVKEQYAPVNGGGLPIQKRKEKKSLDGDVNHSSHADKAPYKPIFEAVLLHIFGVADGEADETLGARAGLISAWLRKRLPADSGDTIGSLLSAFVAWYRHEYNGIALPMDKSKFAVHWHAFTQYRANAGAGIGSSVGAGKFYSPPQKRGKIEDIDMATAYEPIIGSTLKRILEDGN